ncbi:MAG: chorismate synthase [Spirochaetales bacterium]|nr:chorismate synthase [Spirochaetales bacterium]
MIGCHLGRIFQVTVGGGSYQEGLTAVLQGVPAGMSITEPEIYADLLLRKPGADELSSPRKEPDLPVIYCGVNAADTVENAGNKHLTNGTPLCILIPNLDRHFIHIKQYQDTNRTPRPGHASFASFNKYGLADDAIGAGIFSGRYSSTIVAAGAVAKKILAACGIRICSYVKEAAGVNCGDIVHDVAFRYTESYKKMRRDYDPFYQEIYEKGRIHADMRFLEKMSVFAEIEKEIDQVREKAPAIKEEEILEKYRVHHIVNCPDISAAKEMVEAVNRITATGDSSGGIVEIIVDGVPVGLGEPVFYKLDAELGRMLGIGAVKAVEIGAGIKVKDMTGYECNDQMRSEKGKVIFDSNNAGGITGGLATGQPLVIRCTVKPTPTINKKQHTIDKYTLENRDLGAITRRDPTIVARIWPVAENYTALVVLDNLIAHFGYQRLQEIMRQESKQ